MDDLELVVPKDDARMPAMPSQTRYILKGVAQVVVQSTRRVARTLKTDADLDATVRDAQGSEVFENRLRGAHSGAANASAAAHLACESHQISEDGLGEVGGLRVGLRVQTSEIDTTTPKNDHLTLISTITNFTLGAGWCHQVSA